MCAFSILQASPSTAVVEEMPIHHSALLPNCLFHSLTPIQGTNERGSRTHKGEQEQQQQQQQQKARSETASFTFTSAPTPTAAPLAVPQPAASPFAFPPPSSASSPSPGRKGSEFDFKDALVSQSPAFMAAPSVSWPDL